MYLKLTKEDILSSYSSGQLEIKRKYLLDTLFYRFDLQKAERSEINYLLDLIKLRIQEISG